MSKTKVQLRERVSAHLGQASIDQTIPAEDAVQIDAAIDDATATLKELGLVWWTADAIPDAVVFAMTLASSALAAAKFGKSGQGFEGGFAEGQRLLRSLKPQAPVSPMRPRYY